MKTGSLIALFLMSVTFLLSGTCNKNDDIPLVTNPCWQAFSPLGADVNGLLICDKTKAEAEAAWPQYWFYNSTETKYWWKAQQGANPVFYAGNIPQSMADKHKSKITGLYKPTLLYYETLFPDSCSKLFVGKIVTYRETTDSLITREFSKKM